MDKGITLFLCGDVMTGRGIDQILPHPGDPVLYESYVKDARRYVELAEQVNGHIGHSVDYKYIWGSALEFMKQADVRIINLETSITSSDNYVDKGINYRMHPENVPCLTAAKIDCCALTNNHIMDWGPEGLLETVEVLDKVGIGHAGAGNNDVDAGKPCILTIAGKGRILVFSYGLTTSGIPSNWKATKTSPGVHLLDDLSTETIGRINDEMAYFKKPEDLVVASIHWGGNWGFSIPQRHRQFAHHLIDEAGVDIVHGHSSHHVLGMEVYKHKPIIYGCGDFLNDYEGIRGHEDYHANLGLMYFVTSNAIDGRLISLKMVPSEIKKFQITQPDKKNREWLKYILNREGWRFGTRTEWTDDHTLNLAWD